MSLVLRVLVAAGLLGAGAGVAAGGALAVLPGEGRVASGLRIDGVEVDAARSAESLAEHHARAALGRRVTFRDGAGPVVEASLEELGATVDAPELARRIAAVAHENGFAERLDAALEARRGRVDVRVAVSMPVEPLAERLDRYKEERDASPRAARLDLATRTASGDAPGRYVDVYAAAGAVDVVLTSGGGATGAAGAIALDLPELQVMPSASADAVVKIETGAVLARYETRFGFGGAQAGRARNIARAAAQMEGVVLMPGETVSFNANVGPRSEDNGFALAPEIYKGEMREGVGGGTCQVSGTLHAAAFFAGLEVVERANHSRPSGYIRMGLDATVVYPVVDLKMRNPYDFPVVIHTLIDKGTLAIELLGRERPATVELGTDTVGVADFKRKVEEAPWLPAGKFVKKQKGIRGYSIRKTRRIHLKGGEERVEVTTDVYPPTFEIYLVPPGTNPDEALPPVGEAPAATGQG